MELIESYTLATTAGYDHECGAAGRFSKSEFLCLITSLGFGLTVASTRHVAPPQSKIAVAANNPHVSRPAVDVWEGEVLDPEPDAEPGAHTHSTASR